MDTVAEAHTGRATDEPDQMLRRLVREALFHVHSERRNLASAMVSASPYAWPIAEAVLGLTQDRELVAAMSWSMLRHLGHQLPRERVASIALKERRLGVQAQALVTLGLCHGPLTTEVAEQLVTIATTGTAGLRHAATFALGMAGHPHLDVLAQHSDRDVRHAALWWRALGPSLHDD